MLRLDAVGIDDSAKRLGRTPSRVTATTPPALSHSLAPRLRTAARRAESARSARDSAAIALIGHEMDYPCRDHAVESLSCASSHASARSVRCIGLRPIS